MDALAPPIRVVARKRSSEAASSRHAATGLRDRRRATPSAAAGRACLRLDWGVANHENDVVLPKCSSSSKALESNVFTRNAFLQGANCDF
jgi:hypothetical protein